MGKETRAAAGKPFRRGQERPSPKRRPVSPRTDSHAGFSGLGRPGFWVFWLLDFEGICSCLACALQP